MLEVLYREKKDSKEVMLALNKVCENVENGQEMDEEVTVDSGFRLKK